MKIKRTLDVAKASYDLTELSREQFSHLFNSYEKQMYIYYNRSLGEAEGDELYKKMKQMVESDILII